MDIELRGLTREDVPAWNRLLADVEAVDDTGEHYNEADLAEELDNPDLVVGRDVVGAYDGTELVGWFQVYARSAAGDFAKIHVHGGVRPDRRGRGIGTLLVERMLARSDEAHAEKHPRLPAKITTSGLSSNMAQAELLAGFGLLPERWSFTMRADLAELDGPWPVLPEGLALRRYDASLDAAMMAAHNEAFLDHPNFTPWNDVMWKQWVTESRSFRPELSFVAVEEQRPDRVVCYVQTAEFDAHFHATGRREAYVGKVGTLREHRGRGLAGALLRHSLLAYRDAGFDEAALDVDSDNPTGALGVYQRAGFRVERRFADYVLGRAAR
ncbi:MAG TPA: GNAT family N-acetyltransferase [Nocardioidaceae bacterium]|jgi:mycothiol synthase|nr:GNAT family N-acetyltransferase [Nocardioidaceae bacterium]